MSRWLQQQVQAQFPEVEILEVLEADFGYYQVDVPTCEGWETTNGLTHPVLRDVGDPGSIASLLQLEVKDIMVLDRQLKVVFTGRVTDTFSQTRVISTLSQLP